MFTNLKLALIVAQVAFIVVMKTSAHEDEADDICPKAKDDVDCMNCCTISGLRFQYDNSQERCYCAKLINHDRRYKEECKLRRQKKSLPIAEHCDQCCQKKGGASEWSDQDSKCYCLREKIGDLSPFTSTRPSISDVYVFACWTKLTFDECDLCCIKKGYPTLWYGKGKECFCRKET